MLKNWVAALALSALAVAGAGGAQAQSPSEATRWVVPVNMTGNGAVASAARVTVYNVGARPARVALVSLTAGNRRNSDVVLVQPGQSASFPEITTATDFAVVVSDAPVIASATIDRIETRVQTPFKVAEPSDPGQVTLQNQQNNQILRGNFVPYTWIIREDVRVLPIDCAGAPAGHFACSVNLPRDNTAQGAAAPRPTVTAPTTPPPQQPEGRYSRAPGVVPGDGQRLTPTPQ